MNLGFIGPSFTWTNKRMGLANISERLDRAVASLDWRTMFLEAVVSRLPRISSNHCPILLNLYGTQASLPEPFHFEECWLQDSSCFPIISKAWARSFFGMLFFLQIVCKLKAVKKALHN